MYSNKIKRRQQDSIVKVEWDKALCVSIFKTYIPDTRLLTDSERGGDVRWGQSTNNSGTCSPSYNQYIGETSNSNCNCGHYFAGCGSVAMGQIMWAFKWPKKYFWDQIPAFLENTTDVSKDNTIARIIHDAYNASDTDPVLVAPCEGSWTTLDKINAAFPEFGYHGVDKRIRNNWSDVLWFEMIRNKINCGRPVLYRADESLNSKHFLVIEGYELENPDNFFINWGWRGVSNGGSYNLSSLDGYIKNHKAIIGISPSFINSSNNISSIISPVHGVHSVYARSSVNLNSGSVASDGNLLLSAGENIIINSNF